MTFDLRFKTEARKEWDRLGATVQKQLKKKLKERLENPHVPASKLHGSHSRYKIKLRSSGFRLVYEVRDDEVMVVVIAVGKRDRNAVYAKAAKRWCLVGSMGL